MLWAFAHLFYVRDPIYLRGVELTIVAVLYGLIFLRFDLTTTIVAHLAYNAGLTALPLLRSGEPYFVANGALVVVGLVVPLIPGTIRALRRRLGEAPPPSSPAIRPATREDLARLPELAADLDGTAWMDDPSAVVLCLWAGDGLAGVGMGKIEPDGVGRVPVLFLAPQWRRRYWGSRLVAALSQALREQGATALQVTVPSGNWALARFWDAQGWKPAAVTYRSRLGRSPNEQAAAAVSRLLRRVRVLLGNLLRPS